MRFDWIKIFASPDPNADSKIIKFNCLLRVVAARRLLLPFISNLFLSFISTDHKASIYIVIMSCQSVFVSVCLSVYFLGDQVGWLVPRSDTWSFWLNFLLFCPSFFSDFFFQIPWARPWESRKYHRINLSLLDPWTMKALFYHYTLVNKTIVEFD